MRPFTIALAATALLSSAAVAQNPPMGGQRMQMPDHWLTWDSVTTAVGLKGDQASKVQAHYKELNAVMKTAADERAKMREQFQSSGGQPSEDMRSQMMAMREKMDSLQTQVDAHYQAMRDLLTPEQQGKFDMLPHPQVRMRRRMGQ